MYLGFHYGRFESIGAVRPVPSGQSGVDEGKHATNEQSVTSLAHVVMSSEFDRYCPVGKRKFAPQKDREKGEMMMFTIPFQIAWQHEKAVGSKAKNLSFLMSRQLPVPDGFVITMEALLRTLDAGRLHLDDGLGLAEKLKKAEIPDEVKKEIKARFDRLGESFAAVAVRSSSAAEDMEGASFAGQYESYLNVTSFADLLAKIRLCWASMFTEQVLVYLDKMEIAVTDLSMGVVVQGLVYSDVSGVIFSANPITKNPHEVVINASYGLGEAIVSGMTTPDLYIVDKKSGELRKERGLKEVKIIAGTTGTQTVETAAEEQRRFCLTDSQVRELESVARKVEKIYGHSVDLEFGMQQGRIYLLQARPITTAVSEFQWSILLNEEDKKDPFWFHDETHLPGPKSPLFASFMIPAFVHGFNTAFGRLQIPVGETRIKLYLNHIYQSMQPYRGDMEECLVKHQEIVRPLFPVIKKRMMEAVERELMPVYDRLDQDRLTELSLAEARAKVEELFRFYQKAWEVHFDVVGPYGAVFKLLERLHEQLTGKKDRLFVQELLVGVMNKSLETDRELWKLAERAKQQPEVLAAFREESADRLADRLGESDSGQTFLSEVRRMLDTYGYRKKNTHEFLGETWIEDVSIPLSHIQTFLYTEYDFDREHARVVLERDQKYRSFLDGLPDCELKRQFMQVYEWALDAACVGDDHHFYIDAMISAKSRLFLLNVGNTLVKHGVMKENEDLFFLYYDELLQALEHPRDLRRLIAERKEEFTGNQNRDITPCFGKPSPELMENPQFAEILGSLRTAEEDDKSGRLTGFAVSQGTYTGKVKVIRSEEEFGKLEKGEILVCKTTTPTWTILFSKAAAVVTDAGGMLSHSGIIAREYRLPAVVGTRIATVRLKDGDKVTVDGTNGTVTIHD
ncbi:PEP/pyruvate-binding domain-containing protein [Paenactinomyces guangxiensis]|uniref:Phosphotransferase n=1 Tax=Paenactinomyces guangxiensis TaxID=1490290 RepID=A0A7W1WUJ7_9BACL|nr:PEP/pyruvate-binding domain-containing protein [Paenactinomyces guangxiensis]MBA4496106.1 phosphotransferase [Paenactinomyces guangxiensis]MBH8593194.1 phosphotransferase [Paenactinomyces guangxiensis]